MDLDNVTPADVRDYKVHLQTVKKYKPATINRRLASLRASSPQCAANAPSDCEKYRSESRHSCANASLSHQFSVASFTSARYDTLGWSTSFFSRYGVSVKLTLPG